MFKDSQGRSFESLIVLPTAVELKSIGVDLGADINEVLKGLQSEPELLGQVLYLVHQEAAEKLQVAPEQFGRLLNGDVLPNAVDSLIEAIINFSHPATRAPLRKLMETSKVVQAGIAEQMMQIAERVDPQQVLSTLSKQLADSPESSESTLKPTEENGSPIPSGS